MNVNLYDFDGTIYDGDSTIDFYLFCLNKQITLLKYLPIQVLYTFFYFLKIVDKKKWKEKYFVFLKGIHDIEYKIESFWQINQNKIKKWYIDKNHENDIIISASPEFLLLPISKKLDVLKLIGTVVDPKTGIFLSENCRGEEKVKRLKNIFPSIKVEEAYTDTLSDEPIIKLASKGYMVKGNKIYNFYN
ncbi:MAG: haloacid dehalogenase-like hydrolase [Bacilli bacterium]